MPELPEVEIMARHARRWAGDRVVRTLDVLDADVLRTQDVSPEAFEGARVTGVVRRAKHLAIETTAGDLCVHFRMTGKLVQFPGKRRTRWTLHLDDGGSVSFIDTRRLGELRILAPGGARAWFESLGMGPDAYPNAGDASWWAARFSGARAPLKVALMDQRRVAGIGNILASEILWRAQLSPFGRAADLHADGWARIAAATDAVIDDVIAHEDGDEIRYVNEAGGEDPGFAVYGREGLACPRCAAPIARAKQSSRSTFWCASCQPAPDVA